MTVHVSRIKDGAAYYTSLASEKASSHYYADGGGAGRWVGEGRHWFHLDGVEVTEERLGNLFQGRSPTGQDLGIKAGGRDHIHRAGYDITADPPKPVSILRFLAPESEGKKIEESHVEAADFIFRFAEQHLAWARLGKAGHTKVRTSLLGDHVVHHLSRAADKGRPEDMQLHSHIPTCNIAKLPGGKFQSLWATELYRNQRTMNALYMCHLSFLLEERQGLVTERAVVVKNEPQGEVRRERAWFTIAGISDQAIETFSKRRTQILRDLKERGVAGAKEAEASALRTRAKKDKTVTALDLIPLWEEEASRVGLSREVLAALFHQAQKRETPLAARIEGAITKAIEKLTQSEAHFGKMDLIREAAENAIGQGINAKLLLAAIEHRLEHSPELVSRGPTKEERRYSTRENFKEERELLGTAKALSEEQNHRVGAATVEKVLTKKRWQSLKDEQREAVKHIAKGYGLSLVSGMAGTGKTTMLQAAQEVLNDGGFRVVGAAFTGRAASELEGAGIRSSTIHRLLRDLESDTLQDLKHHSRQLVRAALGKSTYTREKLSVGRKTVVVVDEAGMCPTELLNRLAREVRARGGALVLVGDEAQVQPIAAGGPFRSLLERFRGRGVSLKQVTRQKEAWQVEASHHFREGNAKEGLRLYKEHGCFNVAEDIHEAMVKKWVEGGGLKRPKDFFMVAPTRADVCRLNELAQAERMKGGVTKTRFKVRVNPKGLYLGVPKLEVGESTIYEGDRIMLTRNFTWKEYRKGKVQDELDVRNGDLATLHRIDHIKNTIEVTLDRDKKRIVIPLTHYHRYGPALELGYAGTVHKSQGGTFKQVAAMVGSDRELTYVATSRHKEALHLFARTEEINAEDGQELIRTMSRSHQKDLFLDVSDHPQEQEMM